MKIMPYEIFLIMAIIVMFLVFFFILNKLEKAKKFDSELNRKILHIGTGICGVSLPFLFKTKISVIILVLCFFAIIAIVRNLKNTGAKDVLETKSRKTWGDVYFVSTLAFLWIFSSDDKIMYCLPIVILMFSDAFAALIGKFYGKYKYDTGFGTKSLEGSIIFFLSTYILCSNFFLLFSDIKNMNIVLISLLISTLTMIIEAISWNGLDNFFIPLYVYLFLRLNLQKDTVDLVNRLILILGLLTIVYLNRKKTTLTNVAQVGSLFFMYVVTVLGGFSFLLPPLMLYVSYYHYTPKVKRQEKDSLKGLLTIGFLAFFWIIVGILLERKSILNIYIYIFSLYFGIINIIRYNASHLTELTGNKLNKKLIFISIIKALLFFIINYAILLKSIDLKIILENIVFLIAGILLYTIFIDKIPENFFKNSHGGEKKVFFTTIIVFICSLLLLIIEYI